MWLVDSSVWIDYFAGRQNKQTDLLDGALGHEKIGLGDLMLAEVLQGYRHRREYEYARDALLRFNIYRIGGTRLCIKSADNYHALRRKGLTIRKTIDCLIATFAIEHDFALLHNDRDFKPFVTHFGLREVDTDS